MTIMLLLGAIGFVLVGLVYLFAKDVAWQFTEWRNANRGVASDRTPEWETSATISGVVSILVGLALIWAVFATGH